MATHCKIFFAIYLCIIAFSCNNDNPASNGKGESGKEKCKYGTPTPIFSKDLDKVAEHFFSANGQKAIEHVKFENGLELDLIQAGCDELTQSYQFSFSKDLSGDDQFWIEKAVEQFRYLSGLSEDHISLSIWAGAIESNIETINMGTPFEPEHNIFIKIDKIPSGEKTILVVTLGTKG